LSVVQKEVEPSIIAHRQDKGPRPPGWKRPFLETPSANRKPIAELIEHTVEFPEKDESTGELLIYYMGPRDDDFLGLKARTLYPVSMQLTHHDEGNRSFEPVPHFLSYCSSQ
jgi:hypothetical protein